jgi:hypothetical protein
MNADWLPVEQLDFSLSQHTQNAQNVPSLYLTMKWLADTLSSEMQVNRSTVCHSSVRA